MPGATLPGAVVRGRPSRASADAGLDRDRAERRLQGSRPGIVRDHRDSPRWQCSRTGVWRASQVVRRVVSHGRDRLERRHPAVARASRRTTVKPASDGRRRSARRRDRRSGRSRRVGRLDRLRVGRDLTSMPASGRRSHRALSAPRRRRLRGRIRGGRRAVVAPPSVPASAADPHGLAARPVESVVGVAARRSCRRPAAVGAESESAGGRPRRPPSTPAIRLRGRLPSRRPPWGRPHSSTLLDHRAVGGGDGLEPCRRRSGPPPDVGSPGIDRCDVGGVGLRRRRSGFRGAIARLGPAGRASMHVVARVSLSLCDRLLGACLPGHARAGTRTRASRSRSRPPGQGVERRAAPLRRPGTDEVPAHDLGEPSVSSMSDRHVPAVRPDPGRPLMNQSHSSRRCVSP